MFLYFSFSDWPDCWISSIARSLNFFSSSFFLLTGSFFEPLLPHPVGELLSSQLGVPLVHFTLFSPEKKAFCSFSIFSNPAKYSS
jgi:hypothetical protein